MTATSLELNGITIKKNQLKGSIQAVISDFSQTGQLNIQFGTNLLIPKNISALVLFQALEFYLIQSNSVLDLNTNSYLGRFLN